jgi:hypothetical protein
MSVKAKPERPRRLAGVATRPEDPRLAELRRSFVPRLRTDPNVSLVFATRGDGDLYVTIVLTEYSLEAMTPVSRAMYDFEREHDLPGIDFWVLPEDARPAVPDGRPEVTVLHTRPDA